MEAMRVLHHHPFFASSRLIRLVLAERELIFLPKEETPWERSEDFLSLNPAGEVPVLVGEDGEVLCGAQVIVEFLEETESDRSLIWGGPAERAEIRRLTNWFESKFAREVGGPLLMERFIKRFSQDAQPSSTVIRAALSNLQVHLSYIDWLAGQGKWLAGKELSLADLAAAAHLSVLDYFGDIHWDQYPEAKDWYAKIKSRPAFRDLLGDKVTGLIAAPHYSNFDF